MDQKEIMVGLQRFQIEIDYEWDWQKDSKVSQLLIAEWNLLNELAIKVLSNDSESLLVIGGGGSTFFQEFDFNSQLRELVILNPTMNELTSTPPDAWPKEKLTLVRAVAEQNPIENESVDDVLISSTIDHVCSPTDSIKEVYRILKPGGAIVITLGNSASWYRNLISFFRIPITEDHAHNFHFDASQVRALLNSNNFVEIEYRTSAYLRIPRRLERILNHRHITKTLMVISNSILPIIFGKNSGGMLIVWARKPIQI
jgi:SAM-dependent methyltransferase